MLFAIQIVEKIVMKSKLCKKIISVAPDRRLIYYMIVSSAVRGLVAGPARPLGRGGPWTGLRGPLPEARRKRRPGPQIPGEVDTQEETHAQKILNRTIF